MNAVLKSQAIHLNLRRAARIYILSPILMLTVFALLPDNAVDGQPFGWIWIEGMLLALPWIGLYLLVVSFLPGRLRPWAFRLAVLLLGLTCPIFLQAGERPTPERLVIGLSVGIPLGLRMTQSRGERSTSASA